jgi:clan AA aspartic protease (TIGR02281 family)
MERLLCFFTVTEAKDRLGDYLVLTANDGHLKLSLRCKADIAGLLRTPSLFDYPPQRSQQRARTVPLQKSGSTFVVAVTINNTLQLPFIIDSGASDVSIPADVVSTLMRTGTINDTDFLGELTYRLADGSVVPSTTFRITSLKVGDHVLENVTGSVAPVSGALLLGQSFLSRFQSWTIDNRRMVLVLE